MNSTKPYLIRAFYEWIVDNNCTPYLVVNANFPEVSVPLQYIDNGQIVLNVSVAAVQSLTLGNSSISFSARFSGISHDIYVPIGSILAIYAKENGRGMVFAEEEAPPPTETTPPSDASTKGDGSDSSGKGKSKGGKGHLTVVK